MSDQESPDKVRGWVIAGVAVVVVSSIGSYLYFRPGEDVAESTSETVVSVSEKPSPGAESTPATDTAEADTSDVTPDAGSNTADVSDESDAESGPVPTFDIVRVDPAGGAIVAGSAAPGSVISVEVDGTEIATATSDGSGSFAAMFDLPESDDARTIKLVTRDADGQKSRSEETVILTPSGASMANAAEDGSQGDTIVVSADPDGDTPAGDGASVAPGLDTETAAVVSATDSQSPSGTPTVLLSGKDGISVLQPASVALERLKGRVVIDVISYAEDGSVVLAGRADSDQPKANRVRVYLNNKPVQTAEVAKDGSWRLRLPQVKPGIYTLRVEQIDSADRVVARFETPFKREDPVTLASLGLSIGTSSASVITVQPGYTLWAIATDRYGDGLEYVQIFEANKKQINDPDLIYPGQVFDLPDGDAAADADDTEEQAQELTE